MTLENFIQSNFNSISKNFNFAFEASLFIIVSGLLWILIDRRIRKTSIQGRLPPGPRGLPFLGYMPFLGEEPWKTLSKLQKKYGDIVGLYIGSKFTVVLNEYKIAKEVLSHPAALDRGGDIFTSDNIDFGFAAANGKVWMEQRRFCFVTSKDLGLGKEHWENIVLNDVLSFVKDVRNAKGKPIDITTQLYLNTASTILSLLLGRTMTSDDDRKAVQIAVDYNEIALTTLGPTEIVNNIPGARKLFEVLKIGSTEISKNVALKMRSLLRKEIDEHKSLDTYKDVHNFINVYLERMRSDSSLKDEASSFSDKMLEGNLHSIIVGAVDTMTNSFGWTLRLLAKHQDMQNKVYRELMEVVGKEGRAAYEDRNKLPYTFAFLLEVQRVASLVPITTTRWATEDIHINGYVIPKGSELFANAWALNHDPQYWEKPEEFRPEHFLTPDGTQLKKQPLSYAAFSYGKRNCPGETVAYRHLLFFVSEIVKAFRISTPGGEDPCLDIVPGLVTRLKPQKLCFTER